MRVDKYLWCVRYYKTRNIGTEACKKNQVTVNGNIAKPSKEVLPGDTVTLRKDQITRVLVVLDIPANRVGPKLVDIYRKDETPAEALAHLEMLRLSRDHYRGEGRPTKKDRRDLDEFSDEADFDFDPED